MNGKVFVRLKSKQPPKCQQKESILIGGDFELEDKEEAFAGHNLVYRITTLVYP
jgi:hypothetical protein